MDRLAVVMDNASANPSLTLVVAAAGMVLVVAAIAWFVSPRARSRLRRARTAVLLGIIVLLAIVWVFKGRGQ